MTGIRLDERQQKILKETGTYVIAILLGMLLLIWVMNLWKADLSVPFSYSGDGMMFSMYVKGIIDNGWYLQNDYLGAPFGLSLNDYPNAGNLDCLIIKLIGLFTPSYGLVFNLFFLLTFPLTIVTGLYALRQFNVSRPIAIAISILYTFVPYHFLRGEPHIFFASYFMVPLIIMVALWLSSEKYGLYSSNKKLGWDILKNWRFILCLIICVLMGSEMGYYVVFSMMFMALGGIIPAVYRKDWKPLLVSVIFVLVLTATLLINTAPTLVYQMQYGDNAAVGNRTLTEAEFYGMKIIQLILPIYGHRIGFLAEIRHLYDSHAPLINENSVASLGIIGSTGFLILIGLIFIKKLPVYIPTISTRYRDLQILALFNISAILLGTVGGFGAIITALVPVIRCYNRISIFIAFFSLMTVAIFADLIYRKFARGQLVRVLSCVLIILVLLAGIYDQTTVFYVPNYDALKTMYQKDDDFIRQIEQTMPQQSMIFQLPYMPFPESPTLYKLGDSQLFAGYLHSENLRWSFAPIKGREADRWMKHVSDKTPEDMVATVSFAGYEGIYVAGAGYEDRGASIVSNLSMITGVKPIVSKDNMTYFFDLREYNDRHRQNYSTAEWEAIKFQTLDLSAYV